MKLVMIFCKLTEGETKGQERIQISQNASLPLSDHSPVLFWDFCFCCPPRGRSISEIYFKLTALNLYPLIT